MFFVGKVDIAMTNSVLKRRGGQQVGIGPAPAAKCGSAAGLLVFLVGAAHLALVGLVAKAGVVETQAVFAAALGRPRGGRVAAARLVAAGRLAAVRGGGSEGRLLTRDSRGRGCGGGGGAASSGVWDIQSALQRWIISSVVLKARVLIRLLMWRGSLRRKRAVWASFIVAGCRVVRLSHRTEGLVSRHMG
jgi:hypothetical protein